jgi:hypothetical protein
VDGLGEKCTTNDEKSSRKAQLKGFAQQIDEKPMKAKEELTPIVVGETVRNVNFC